jgi:hypothetical protein
MPDERTHNARVDDDQFGIAYVVNQLTKAVDRLTDKVDAMATKGELAVLFARMEEKADKEEFKNIDRRLTRIERNQLPPWTIPSTAIIVTIVLSIVFHFWK